MPTSYTGKEILSMFDDNRPYQRACVNYKGQEKKSGDKPRRYYSEILAERILKDSKFDVLPYTPDRENFFVHDDAVLSPEAKPDPDSEKGLCAYWCEKGFDEGIGQTLGKPVDREVNLVNGTKVNIDLVSVRKQGTTACVYLIEVKGRKPESGEAIDSDETLLRCALEIETYYKSIKKKEAQFIDEFRKKYPETAGDIELKKAILIPAGSFAASQCDSKLFPMLNQLVEKWGIEIVIYDNSPRKY